LSALVGQ